ncbi:MAG: recombinase family protein [Bacteroidales bacterium]|nr:recombinase family protein [Bacteroidales bacterium]
MLVGYARISTADQSKDMQLDELKKDGCKKIYQETVSGAKTERVELKKALEDLRKGDVLVVWKLDRLGRSLKHLIEVVSDLNECGVGFKSLKESIDTTTNGGRLIFHIFGALAEFERGIIQERTKAGLKAARARGRLGGRPRKMDKAKIEMAQALYDSRTMTIQKICKQLGISKGTFYRYLKTPDSEKGDICN